MSALARYFADVARRRFAYGSLDCCTFMADWLMRRGLDDPMKDRRGGYSTYRQFRDAMRSEGGIIASCERRFGSIGLSEADEPREGDVCLVRAPVKVGKRVMHVPTGAIVVSERLRALVTADMGLVLAQPQIIRVWSIA